jgi:hypothetical protein
MNQWRTKVRRAKHDTGLYKWGEGLNTGEEKQIIGALSDSEHALE